jgi:transcriptional regulator with PAS, ATPase and Fis domain
MKCIDATVFECRPKPKTKRIAHISTFEDGTTRVMCDAIDKENPSKCTLKGICTYVHGNVEKAWEVPRLQPGQTLADIVDAAEKQAIEDALAQNDGDREKAAATLDISPTTLWRKMTRMGIENKK